MDDFVLQKLRDERYAELALLPTYSVSRVDRIMSQLLFLRHGVSAPLRDKKTLEVKRLVTELMAITGYHNIMKMGLLRSFPMLAHYEGARVLDSLVPSTPIAPDSREAQLHPSTAFPIVAVPEKKYRRATAADFGIVEEKEKKKNKR